MGETDKAILETRELQVGYGTEVVVDHVTLELIPGKILTLIGPNGGGKSTVLKTIIGRLEPLGGKILLLDRNLKEYSNSEIAREISIVMTERMDPERMTCRDIVETGRYPYTGRMGLLQEEDRRIAQEAMELVHAEELAEVEFEKISDGQRQRVMLARAICQEPEILVLDEPTSYLDIRHKLELLSLLKKMAMEKNIAVILSLHELDLAERISDRIVCIREGRVDRVGTPEDVFEGDYIRKLYDMEKGIYLPRFGVVELEPPRGIPEVFVIGGGGSGITVYRKLQREGTAFFAGILSPGDVEYATAKSLGAEVVETKPFALPGEEEIARAKALIDRCHRVICTLKEFGAVNSANQMLWEYARLQGKSIE